MNNSLELNVYLVHALVAAADSKSVLSLFAKEEENQILGRVNMRRVEELDEILCDVINRIADLMSGTLAYEAMKESEKWMRTYIEQGFSDSE